MRKGVISHFSKCKSVICFVAALLVLVMLFLAGCEKEARPSSESSSSVSSTAESSDDSNSDSENADSDTVQKNEVDPLSGEFSYEETLSNISDNVQEVIPTGNTANLSNPLNGYFDDEAEALRKEIINTGNTEEYYKITGTKYYVSSVDGDDSNSGLSPNEALKSTEGAGRLNLKAGDAVLFERGSVFRLYTTLLAVEGVTYGSYGEGEKPKIYGSPINLAIIIWTPSVKKNVWQIDYVYADCGSMIFDHGEEVGYRKNSLRNLTKNTDFFQDESTNILYVYCDEGNPAKVYESIDIATRISIIGIPSCSQNITIDNLCLKYSGLFGVSGTWDASNITITNCEFGYIGGSTTKDGASRYGNAIQFWTGSKSIVCDHNWIYQTYDTAVSWQGYGGEEFSYENISFSDNLLEYNNGDYEFWDESSTAKNFTMSNNIMRFTSLGWGSRENDGGYRGIDGCFVGDVENMTVDGIYIKDNIIDCPGRMIINLQINPNDLNSGIFVSGTKIYVNSSYRTCEEVLRGFKNSDSDLGSLDATSAEEFIAALERFDSSAVLKWY